MPLEHKTYNASSGLAVLSSLEETQWYDIIPFAYPQPHNTEANKQAIPTVPGLTIAEISLKSTRSSVRHPLGTIQGEYQDDKHNKNKHVMVNNALHHNL